MAYFNSIYLEFLCPIRCGAPTFNSANPPVETVTLQLRKFSLEMLPTLLSSIHPVVLVLSGEPHAT